MLASDFIDKIYAAAASPEDWPALLERLAISHDAKCACLYSVSEWDQLYIRSLNDGGAFQKYFDAGWMEPNERSRPLVEECAPCFRTDSDLYSVEAMATMPVYRDFLIPMGFIGAAGTMIQGTSHKLINISLEGFGSHAAARAALPSLNRLRPHLARAASLSVQIAQAAAQAAIDTLDLAGTGAAVIGRDGRLRANNRHFESSLGDRATVINGRLRLRRNHINDRIERELTSLRADAVTGATIVVDAGDDLLPCVLHLLPLRLAARSYFNADGFILIVADPENRVTPKAGLLRLLFDLTPGEAMLTAELAAGHPLRDAAARRGIAYSTARVYLRQIFAKTGCHRQSELMALLTTPLMAIGNAD